jgi:hypothetical protein
MIGRWERGQSRIDRKNKNAEMERLRDEIVGSSEGKKEFALTERCQGKKEGVERWIEENCRDGGIMGMKRRKENK